MVVENMRKFKRSELNCEILYPTFIKDNKKQTLTKESYHLYVVDISEAGICLRSNFTFPEDIFISFFIRIENNLPFKVLTTVRWVKHEDDCFFCGGEFLALSLEDIHTLRKYVQTHPQLQ